MYYLITITRKSDSRTEQVIITDSLNAAEMPVWEVLDMVLGESVDHIYDDFFSGLSFDSPKGMAVLQDGDVLRYNGEDYTYVGSGDFVDSEGNLETHLTA